MSAATGAQPEIVADMKWLLVAALAAGLVSPAFAADAPAAKPVEKAPAPAGFNWTSCYVGVQGGGSWGKSEHVARSSAAAGSTITGTFNLTGGVAGGAFGCDFQVEKTVLGFENDARGPGSNAALLIDFCFLQALRRAFFARQAPQ